MKHLIIGTAGHIDHGKTSLIKMLTGIDCDTHKEEKARGITINLGFSHLELPSGESVGIIDVPGHKDFINTMVGGACGIDMVLLVIAADSGIMPQTAEHLNIITTLGITKGVIALTKTDLVDDELIEIAKYEITDFLKNTSLKNAPIIGISSHTGQGKEELISAIENTISDFEERESGNLFRMYIDRIFTVRGLGSVVTGSVLGGRISTGNEVFLLPGDKQKLRIRSIERHGKPVEQVIKGDRAAINLIGLKNEDFERGMLISNKQLDSTIMADAYINLFATGQGLSLWSNVTFLSGSFESTARMHLLNKDKLSAGEDAIVQLHFNKPAILVNRDKFIIRNSSDDISLGGGYIIDASPLHHRRRSQELTESLTELCVNILTDKSSSENIKLILNREFRPFDLDEICNKLNINREEIQKEIIENKSSYEVYENSGSSILISKKFDDAFAAKIIKNLEEYHSKNQIFAEGLELTEILGKSGLSKIKSGKIYLELLLNKMKGSGIIENLNKTWIIKGHKPQIDTKTESEINWLEQVLLSYSDEKPVLSEIEEKAIADGINKSGIKTCISYLASKGKIKIFGSEIIHTTILNKNKILLLKHLSNKENGIDIPEYKELIPGTKKFRGLLSDIFEAEKLIQFIKDSANESRLIITPKGKEFLDANLS
jgi:selenocysteine-specific elongation factor